MGISATLRGSMKEEKMAEDQLQLHTSGDEPAV